jgi:hypothetical protein
MIRCFNGITGVAEADNPVGISVCVEQAQGFEIGVEDGTAAPVGLVPVLDNMDVMRKNRRVEGGLIKVVVEGDGWVVKHRVEPLDKEKCLFRKVMCD